MTKRIDYLDQVAGILICYMMLMHILLWKKIPLENDSLWLEPLKFFMFWFFFKSGMFYKQKTTKDCVIRGGKKLLYPFIIFSLLGYIIHTIVIYMSGDRNWMHYLLTPIKELLLGGSIGGNDVLWFLTSLFMVQFLHNELMKQKVQIPYIAIGGIIVAFLCHLIHIEKPAYLANVSIGISLYTLGYLWKEKQFYKKYASMAIILYLGIMMICPSHIDLRTNTLYGNSIYILAILFSISGCIVINNFFRYLPKLKFINYIGKNSMLYYVTHMLILELVMLIPFERFGISEYVVFTIMCASCLILPAMIRKIFLFVNPAKLSAEKN